MEKIIRHKSGYSIKIATFFYEEIHKYSPGFVIINPEGQRTNRICPSPDLFNSEDEANKLSWVSGRTTLLDYLHTSNDLSFS